MRKILTILPILVTSIVSAASFQGIGTPSCENASVYGVSGNGIVVGGGGYAGEKNWIWNNGVYSSISDIPVGIRNISDDGSVMIAGDTYLDKGNPIYKVVNGITQVIPGYAQNTWTIAESLSKDGSKIVGGTRSGVPWIYQNGNYSALPLTTGYFSGSARAISSDGYVIAGTISGTNTSNTVLWTSNGIEILSNPVNMAHSSGLEISGNGSTVVGYSYNNFAFQQPAIWRNGIAELIPMLSGVTSALVTSVSFDGSLVFGSEYFGGNYDGGNAFVWDEINGTRLLKDFLEDDYGLNLTGWDLRSVSATDASGNIITGYGINPQGQGELWIATIPEPATLLFFGIGGLLLRKRK